MKPIPYGKQSITTEDIAAVVEVLQSDYLTQGPKIGEFEEAFAKYIGCKYAVAVSNGTAALHLSALSLGLGPGDKVITTPITFSATANAVLYCGAEVVFADIDRETYLLDINKVRNLLEASPKGTYKGIMPVDFTGLPIDMEAYRALADEFGCWIIEDACHAPGGFFIDSAGKVQKCGNGAYADLAIFSFHPVKHIAAGEGGMITTNNKDLYQRLLSLRTHGITRDTQLFSNPTLLAGGEGDYPGWYMEMIQLGYNYRLTDIQAALGLSQLQRAEEGIEARNRIADHYDSHLSEYGIVKQVRDKRFSHAYHLYVVESEQRLHLYNHLREHNVFSQIHYVPIHLMPYYRNKGYELGSLPRAEDYYKHCLSLPMYPGLVEGQQRFVIEKVISSLHD